MERFEAFEKMLSDIIEQSEKERAVMDDLKAKGKEKTATYKQYMGNRLILISYHKVDKKSVQKLAYMGFVRIFCLYFD